MSDIKKALTLAGGEDEKIGNILIEFYEDMRKLEKDPERGGQQATLIIMTIQQLKIK